jgi:hypothetical protein
MGLFSIFKGKSNNSNLENMVMGYLRSRTSELLGIESNTKEYETAMESAADRMMALSLLVNKQIHQDIANTLMSVSSDERFHEMFGEYIFLLFVRFSVISKHILSGKVKAEEATPDILANVLHNQIKNFINKVK